MDLGNDHQWLLASQKERQLDVMYFLMELDYTNSEVILPQNSWVHSSVSLLLPIYRKYKGQRNMLHCTTDIQTAKIQP